MKETLTKEYLIKEYVEKERSTSSIAAELNTFPETINRALRKFGIPKRTKGEALATAYKTGSKEHPTKGKKSSKETKLAISESNYRSWHSKTEEEKQEHAQKSKDLWEQKSKKEQDEFIKSGLAGIKKASKLGSKMEHFLAVELRNNGYNIVFHYKNILANEKLEVDIFVKEVGVAIEIDGPSHFFPVWGEEALEKTQKADLQKMGLILGKGLSIIRIRHFGDTKSDKYKRECLRLLLEALNNIKKQKSPNKYLEITPTPYSGQLTEKEISPEPISEQEVYKPRRGILRRSNCNRTKVTTNAKKTKRTKPRANFRPRVSFN